ncbi:MAG: M48 family metalloprotease [Pirellulales bacterium]
MSRFPVPLPRRYSQYGDNDPRRQAFGGSSQRSSFKARLIIAAIIAIFALVSYYGRPGDENKITGEKQRVALSNEADEVVMGLQAAPEMVQMHGGPSRDREAQAMVSRVGEELLEGLDKQLSEQGRQNPYRDKFRFTLLADPQTVNAFALPGGQVFITAALFRDLETEGQLAGVLGHEIGHVIERHGNQRMAQNQLFQGLAAAGGVAGGDQQSAQMAQAVAQMVQMKYGRGDELESDKWGVRLTYLAGYDPRAMIGVMEVLDRASGGAAPPEFFSTHPKPANRVEYIKHVIAEEFPNGVPDGLKK